MKPKQIMLIAGEASGDLLAAELVYALREKLTAAEIDYTTDWQPLRTGLEPHFFGAGGPEMKAAGVELAYDLTEHSIIGIPGLKDYLRGRRVFRGLLELALNRQPDVIIGVDYNYFNLRFAHAIKHYVSSRRDWFHDWQPKLVKLVSPQLWASRESRVYQIAQDYDLMLTLFPFEKQWYAKRVPKFRVEAIGHPMLDRYRHLATRDSRSTAGRNSRQILLLPGSRRKELRRHVPVMLGALKLIQEKCPEVRAKMVLPSQSLADLAKSLAANVEIQVAGLPQALAESEIAITKTGTIAMECAFFGVPAVTLYKAFWATYQIARRIVKVTSLTMPNLLAEEEIFPEFIQNAATPENISRAALELLQDESRRMAIKAKLAKIVSSLGEAGASWRAAQAITRLLEPQTTATEHEGQKTMAAVAR